VSCVSLPKHVFLRNKVVVSGLIALCGLRSLTVQDAKYDKRDNITSSFAGPVHNEINYLILRALQTTYAHNSHMAMAGHKMATNLIDCALKVSRVDVCSNCDFVLTIQSQEFRRTQFLWEQWDPDTARGQKGHPNAASSLVLLALARK
jgi:hypothetical protein